MKRDAEPANSPNVMDNISKQMQDLKAVMEKQFDPEQIKTEFNSLLDNVTKLVSTCFVLVVKNCKKMT